MHLLRSLSLLPILLCGFSHAQNAPNPAQPPMTVDPTGHLTWWNGSAWMRLANAADVPAPVVVPPIVAPPGVASLATGLNGTLPAMFPNAPWLSPVTAPVSATMTTALQGNFANHYLHMDATVPYTTVDSRVTPLVPVSLLAAGTSDGNNPAESDDVLVPVTDAIAAAGLESGSDAHLLLYDVATQVWINMYGFSGTAATGYRCIAKTIWDATYDWSKGNPRPFGETSEDVSGLPMSALLLRYQDYANPTMAMVNGQMVPTFGHALRITSQFLRSAGYSNGDGVRVTIPPASHSSPNLSGGPITGQQWVLDPAYDTSKMTGLDLMLANNSKVYGFIVCDLGATGMFTATADSRWTGTDLDAGKTIPVTALKVITPRTIYVPSMPQQVAADLTGLVTVFPSGSAPTITSFTQANGMLSWQVTGATYVFIDKLGLVRGNSTAAPSGTYTLTAANPYGRMTKVVPN